MMKKIIAIFKAPFNFILWTYDETKKRCPKHPVLMWMLFGFSNIVFILIILSMICYAKDGIKFLLGA